MAGNQGMNAQQQQYKTTSLLERSNLVWGEPLYPFHITRPIEQPSKVKQDLKILSSSSVSPTLSPTEQTKTNEDFELQKYYQNLYEQPTLSIANQTSTKNILIETSSIAETKKHQFLHHNFNFYQPELTNYQLQQQNQYTSVSETNLHNNNFGWSQYQNQTNLSNCSFITTDNSYNVTNSQQALSNQHSFDSNNARINSNQNLFYSQAQQKTPYDCAEGTKLNTFNHIQSFQQNIMATDYIVELRPYWFFRVDNKTATPKKSQQNNEQKNTSLKSSNTNSPEANRKDNELVNENWLPFCLYDSKNLESAFQSLTNQQKSAINIVQTNGGRYDCDVSKRIRIPIYWNEDPCTIRRGTWFYKKEGYVRFVPYPEQIAAEIESIYADVVRNKRWNQRIELSNRMSGCLVFYNNSAIMHYDSIDDVIKDDSNLIVGNPLNPRIVKRNLDFADLKLYEEVDLEEEESSQIDHLVFLVHGIGEFCDFHFRTIREVVDDFRKISLQLIREHFRTNSQDGSLYNVGRVEFIPIYWHEALHGQQTGNDDQLRLITLPSIPKLRNFTNDTILDALFYTSPVYCQMIVNTVANELNRLYRLFLSRNPVFNGTVAVSGHSLGSLILFDILANQNNENTNSNRFSDQYNNQLANQVHEKNIIKPLSNTGQPLVNYPLLDFRPSCFFALGSPISMFLTIRGVKNIHLEFQLPSCKKMYNIFHPFDPVAYRIEPLVNPEYSQVQPITLPHHKGRKRMHLQIKENFMKMSTDIKEKVISGIRQTWNSVNSIVRLGKSIEQNQQIEDQLIAETNSSKNSFSPSESITTNSTNNEEDMIEEDDDQTKIDVKRPIGALNNGERIDYVLQEKPIEFINEYIFALATHACYWQSEDTCLFFLKELYRLNGVRPSPIRPSPSFNSYLSSLPVINQFGYMNNVQSQTITDQDSQTTSASASASATTNIQSPLTKEDSVIEF